MMYSLETAICKLAIRNNGNFFLSVICFYCPICLIMLVSMVALICSCSVHTSVRVGLSQFFVLPPLLLVLPHFHWEKELKGAELPQAFWCELEVWEDLAPAATATMVWISPGTLSLLSLNSSGTIESTNQELLWIFIPYQSTGCNGRSRSPAWTSAPAKCKHTQVRRCYLGQFSWSTNPHN